MGKPVERREERGYQLRYSEQQPLMADEASRRQKAQKILAVLRDALAPDRPQNFRLLDVGSSTGVIAGELGRAFAEVVGIDIDESGMATAHQNLTGSNQTLLLADAMAMPFSDGSFDVVVLNHVYEHVPDAGRLLEEVWRVLRPGGVAYFAAVNRLALIEPHYRLPVLSWLPPWAADRYLRVMGRGDRYYERPLSYRGLKRLTAKFVVEDYTLRIIREPEQFAATDVVTARSVPSRLPGWVLSALHPLLPTFVLVLRKPGARARRATAGDPGEKRAAAGPSRPA